ncbi:MAG: type II toxin-antitoxin system RelE/ParE family toxin [Methylocystis silviterrae]|uniref:type II toxin-antitoxin system RelE/ParE family toxin n=1 Tax=Methylocystis silviterrae TaxID=2743612 RepID=UPI003C70B157
MPAAGTASFPPERNFRNHEKLETFPERGTRRDDLRPGLRTIGFRRRVTIAFAVETDAVTIIGIFYGGQDLEAALQIDEA